MWPDAPAIDAFLRRASARLRIIAALEGAAGGVVVAVLIALIAWQSAVATKLTLVVAFALAGAVARVVFARLRHPRVAAAVERRVPACQNVLITAAELADTPARVREYVGTIVCRDAARAIADIDLTSVFPFRRAAFAFVTAVALWALALNAATAGPVLRGAMSPDAAEIDGIEITVTPPAYAARAAATLRDPSQITALAGSRVHVRVRANAARVVLETVNGQQVMSADGARAFVADVTADADGFIAIDATAANGHAADRRLIGFGVTPDAPPRVRITAPARDLFVPDTNRVVNVAIEASDDLGLASLALRYTRVSGSGEQFTFVDGEVPLNITRGDDRTWKATAAMRLGALLQTPGDVLVYRGVALDRRPGAAPSESDSYIIELTAPGAVAAEGFAVDDDRDRYGISQAMVILKTERLLARRAGMNADSLRSEALNIAAEQRAVRAEFVFMLGGEVAEEIVNAENLADLDETGEAQGEEDIAAGRLANRGRIDVVRAIRAMSQASTSLNASELDRALVQERAALKSLQAAFARTRYILRALTQRERLDASRRMTGALTGAMRDVRPLVEHDSDPRVVALRRVLVDISALAGATELDARSAVTASALGQRVLRFDPGSAPLQSIARYADGAARAIALGDRMRARRQFDSAAVGLAGVIRAGLPAASIVGPSVESARLEGALTDALRRSAAR